MSNVSINSNLVMYDIKNFLDKYTRFMTKNIYITRDMYNNFMKSYDYLYRKLESDAVLYRENIKYIKMMEIKDNSNSLLKLHNQKYLKKNLGNYDTFFNDINSYEQLDLNQKYVILSNESKSLLINNKNTDLLIIAKIKYISGILKIKQNKILVLVDDDSKLKDLLLKNELDNINIINIIEYKKQLIGENKLVTTIDKFNILNYYITNVLFRDKENFNKLYDAFSNNIYLNKDYKDYDTFFDYHNYMYKRKFLSSKLSLDRFVEREIEKRKGYLRTIRNELVNTKEEVILGNYLCFNNIEYCYDKDNKLFDVNSSNKLFNIKIISDDNINDKVKYNESIIYINKNLINNNLYKEILDDEFSIRRIKKCKLEFNDIYEILKNTISDNYFSEFINKYLIKYLDYYEKNNNYDNTKLNDEQKEVLISIYDYYKKYLENNNFVTSVDINNLLEENINEKRYKYIITYSKDDFNFDSNGLIIKDDYNNIELIKENIKLLYDYKKYLQENKCLVAQNLYTSSEEIDELRNLFLKNNLNIINDYFANNKKKISIYLYDDGNRLKVNKNISKICYEIIRKNDDILIGVNSYNNINSLISKDYLVKVGKNKLEALNKVVDCEELLKIKKSYNKVILPFLVIDSYREDLIDNDDGYKFKLIIYTILSKCKSELILLCPSSKKKYIVKLLKRINNVSIYE